MLIGWGRTEFLIGTKKYFLKKRLSGLQIGDLQLLPESILVSLSFLNSLKLRKKQGGTNLVIPRLITARKLSSMTETYVRTKVLFSTTKNVLLLPLRGPY